MLAAFDGQSVHGEHGVGGVRTSVLPCMMCMSLTSLLALSGVAGKEEYICSSRLGLMRWMSAGIIQRLGWQSSP